MTRPSQKALLITKRDLLIDVVSVFLEGWFQAGIDVADTSFKLEQLLSESSMRDWAFVLVEDDKLLTSAGKTIADLMVPAIVIGKEPASPSPSGRRVIYLRSPIDLQKLSDSIQELARSESLPVHEYCAVRPEILVMSGKDLAEDVYSEDAPGSYALAFAKGHRLSLADAHGKLGSSKFLYMKNADFQAFLKGFAEELQELSGKGAKVFDISSSVALTTSVHELLTQALPELGFTPELQRATRASIDHVVTAIRKDPRLFDLIDALMKNEAEYRTWHSVTLCYLSCRLSSLMTWDSANTHFKLSLASFLHDITFRSTRLHSVRTMEELETMHPSEEERRDFREHPHAAAAIARSMKDFPGDVDHIIAQHHELPSGKGFPLGLNHTKISPLASVFIVAHELAHDLWDKKGDIKLSESVARFEKLYTQGYFKRVIAALKDLTTKESAGA